MNFRAADSVSLSYDTFFLEAMVQRQKGNNDAAFDLLQHCVRLNPKAAEAYFFLAQYYELLKDDSLSGQYYQKAAELEPDNTVFLETLAQWYVTQQNYDNAIKAVERLYNQDKSRDDLLEMLYELYQQTEDYPKAIETLNRIEAAEGKSERLSYAKSEMYTKQGMKQAAIDEMKALASQYPNDLNYKGMYADMLLRNDEEQQALRLYNEILAEEPDNTRVAPQLLQGTGRNRTGRLPYRTYPAQPRHHHRTARLSDAADGGRERTGRRRQHTGAGDVPQDATAATEKRRHRCPLCRLYGPEEDATRHHRSHAPHCPADSP